MSALGQKQTFAAQKGMSPLPPKADMCDAKINVRLVPKADIGHCRDGSLNFKFCTQLYYLGWRRQRKNAADTIASPDQHLIISLTKGLVIAPDSHRLTKTWSLHGQVRDPKIVRGAKDLLGHASFSATEKHYIMAQSRIAGRTLSRIVVQLQRFPR